MSYVQFGECGCKVIDLDGVNCIRINDDSFVLEKMADHNGTVAEIGYPETAEMVARLGLLINDGRKFRTVKRAFFNENKTNS